MSEQGSFILGAAQGKEDRSQSLPKRATIPAHLNLSLSEEVNWWAGYHQGYAS